MLHRDEVISFGAPYNRILLPADEPNESSCREEVAI
jgi:hypothetical protein